MSGHGIVCGSLHHVTTSRTSAADVCRLPVGHPLPASPHQSYISSPFSHRAIMSTEQSTGRSRNDNRSSLACARCREKRKRCSGTRPVCVSCDEAEAECIWLKRKKREVKGSTKRPEVTLESLIPPLSSSTSQGVRNVQSTAFSESSADFVGRTVPSDPVATEFAAEPGPFFAPSKSSSIRTYGAEHE